MTGMTVALQVLNLILPGKCKLCPKSDFAGKHTVHPRHPSVLACKDNDELRPEAKSV